MTETKYWLWLSLALGSVSRRITAVLESFDSPQEVYECHDKNVFSAIEGLDKKNVAALLDKSTDKVEEVWELCKNKGIRILTYSSPFYPESLTNIYDPPYVLYVRCKEKINLNNYLKIAMVGNRSSTEYGDAAATQLAYDISLCGALVVSGMAEGIDGASHKGALLAGAPTVAVLGSGVDVCYPTFHKNIYERIIENGMVISEFPPGTPPYPHNFPIRNRIISGLCEATVVVEAPLSSGSLITADLALEQGREVFAVPGDIDKPRCAGTNNLIKQGAKIVTEGYDVIKEFADLYSNVTLSPQEVKTAPEAKANPQKEEIESYAQPKETKEAKKAEKKEKSKETPEISLNPSSFLTVDDSDEEADFSKNVTSAEQAILDNLMLSPIHIDRLCEITGLSPHMANSSLTLLEMRGLVKSHPGKNFSLKV
ncbi:MAG: DNA-processing protein DprA [Clostridia bacterium]|nr:DNA-processing protein DprA [Clostridia bacterium]